MSKEEQETKSPKPFTGMDGIFILFSIILLGLATNSLQEGVFVSAAYEASLGVSGLLLGVRNPLEYATGLDLSVFNQVAVVGFGLGIVLFAVSLFV